MFQGSVGRRRGAPRCVTACRTNARFRDADESRTAAMRLALFEPDIPQNLGAFIRLAACLGAPLDIIEPCGFPLDDRRIRRAAMDYYDLARIVRHASWQAFMRDRIPGRLVLLTTSGAQRFPDVAFRTDDTLAARPRKRRRAGRGARRGRPSPAHSAAERFALAQCRAGRGDGIERGPSANSRIRCALRLRLPPRCPTTPRSPGARKRRASGSKTCATASAPNSSASRTSFQARIASWRPAASSARHGSASPARTARIAAAAPCQSCAAACSRRWASTSRPCSANSARSSASRSRAPSRIRASSRPASRWWRTCARPRCRRCT